MVRNGLFKHYHLLWGRSRELIRVNNASLSLFSNGSDFDRQTSAWKHQEALIGAGTKHKRNDTPQMCWCFNSPPILSCTPISNTGLKTDFLIGRRPWWPDANTAFSTFYFFQKPRSLCTIVNATEPIYSFQDSLTSTHRRRLRGARVGGGAEGLSTPDIFREGLFPPLPPDHYIMGE